jgi:hypothetical protein
LQISRVFGAMTETMPPGQTLISNLDIDAELRVQMPISAGPGLLFGSPTSYVGERGALLLLRELLEECDSFFDCGAYRGYFVFMAHAATRGRIPIYYFEQIRRSSPSSRPTFIATALAM